MIESIHSFDQLIALDQISPDKFHARPAPAYQNIAGPFGGATAAQLLAAVMRSATRAGSPIAATINFLAPIASDDYVIAVSKTRQNSSTQHWLVELLQGGDGEMKANATIVTAIRRSTWQETELSPRKVPAANDITSGVRESRGRWYDRYDFRFAEGDFPQFASGEAKDDSLTTAWLRDKPGRPLDFASLLAMSDAFFPRIFVRRPQMAPMGTVSMTTYFHCNESDLERVGQSHILATARANVFNTGFFDHTGSLWSGDGQCLATTQQMVYFRD